MGGSQGHEGLTELALQPVSSTDGYRHMRRKGSCAATHIPAIRASQVMVGLELLQGVLQLRLAKASQALLLSPLVF
jgi:hypothetical protein